MVQAWRKVDLHWNSHLLDDTQKKICCKWNIQTDFVGYGLVSGQIHHFYHS